MHSKHEAAALNIYIILYTVECMMYQNRISVHVSIVLGNFFFRSFVLFLQCIYFWFACLLGAVYLLLLVLVLSLLLILFDFSTFLNKPYEWQCKQCWICNVGWIFFLLPAPLQHDSHSWAVYMSECVCMSECGFIINIVHCNRFHLKNLKIPIGRRIPSQLAI